MANLSLYISAGATAPPDLPATGATDWAQCKLLDTNYDSSDRNPLHWNHSAVYWYSWGGLTKNNNDNKHYVEVGAGKRDILVNPQTANGTAFTIASGDDIVCLEYNNVATGTPQSTNYTKERVGNSSNWKITEKQHQDGTSNHPLKGDHFYVFATIPTSPNALVVMCDPIIKNDQD